MEQTNFVRVEGLDIIPTHVGIIMDGNGRWAKKRGMPRTMGHSAGTKRVRDIVRFSSDIGIEALTLYAFSSENWKRPPEEVNFLCNLFQTYFEKEAREMHRENVCIRMIGDPSLFSVGLQETMEWSQALTKDNTGLKLNLALNYGGQAEIIHAATLLAEDVAAGILRTEDITQDKFEEKLYTNGIAPLDLIIRTGGEKRLSNFLMYQAAYAELIFVDDYWPDFTKDRFVDTLKEFQTRSRRFGGL